MFRRSIKSQLIICFFVLMLPVDAFLIVNNGYAKDVVRLKVSETYRNTLDIFVGQTDRNLQQINDYLYKMSVLDSDAGLLMSFPYGSDNYVLTKIRLQNKLNRDIGFYNLIDTIFLYRENDIIFSTTAPNADKYRSTQQLLKKDVRQFVDQAVSDQMLAQDKWMLWHDDLVAGSDFLLKLSEVSPGLYMGAMIRVADILDLLSIQWDYGGIGEGAIYRQDGDRLRERLGVPKQESGEGVALDQVRLQEGRYQTVTDKKSGKRYLLMNRPSGMADVTVSILVPESYLLQGLSYFQKVIYFVEFGIVFIFALYLFFIRRMVFKPLQQLIVGMKKLSRGMLDVRIKTNQNEEFIFLANTFNNMAEQIKTLKIGMYEEQLRAQKMEFKQLQAQINPHFYANSLNIIYNFAALKDHDSVKRMALHLADYFRFIMRVNRDSISLGEEMRHIENYIEIQKFRFPNKLSCSVDVPDHLQALQLPTLSLQPFVENAIIHGFVNRRKPFLVEIVGRQFSDGRQSFLALTIRDNGAGFAPDVLERLNDRAPLPQTESSRLGIMNVVQRLQLRYGEAAAIEFGNQGEEGGAAVLIRLPLGEEAGIQPEGEVAHV
ncbi:sensor histidine kinase [Cohnella zeiphila]|uniref:Histidine kinase n=1 Tax=Cohnella zeiphila TaxID=2761120 RepID=A0A7X0VXI9_9BACL|nr:histidine kinase [Cohnella zeiphila]MBB6733645.1 histidine kinase [Cohnella zeiphila]